MIEFQIMNLIMFAIAIMLWRLLPYLLITGQRAAVPRFRISDPGTFSASFSVETSGSSKHS